MTRKWEDLTGKEFEELKPKVAILPVGTVERHGDHLPLGTDNIVPVWIAEKVGSKLEGSIVLPAIRYGSSTSLAKFPGTINIRSDVFKEYVKNVLLEIARNGIDLIVVINGHGGNTRALQLAAKEVAYEVDATILVLNWWSDVAQEKRNELFRYPGHAGEDETSAIMAIRPDLVKMKYVKDHVAQYPPIKVYSKQIDEMLYPFAVNGKASLARPDKGVEFLNAVVNEIIQAINEIMRYLNM